MSISKAKILSAYIETALPQEILSKDLESFEQLILSKESVRPSLSSDSTKNSFLKAFVPPSEVITPQQSGWRQHHNNQTNTFHGPGFKADFVRGANFHPPEEIVKINIDNIYTFNTTFNIPKEVETFYFRNKNNGLFFGPVSSLNAQNLYQSNKIDSTFEFRTIDIFSFKDKKPFEFISLKEINKDKWEECIIESPLLKYIQPQSPKEEKEDIKVEPPLNSISSSNKKEEESQESPKEANTSKKDFSGHVKVEEGGKWEDPNKKKKKIRPGQKPTTSKPVGLDGQIKPTQPIANPPKKVEKQQPQEDIIELLKPKQASTQQKPPLIEDKHENDVDNNEGFVEVNKGASKKGKKKRRPQEAGNINLGFQY